MTLLSLTTPRARVWLAGNNFMHYPLFYVLFTSSVLTPFENVQHRSHNLIPIVLELA